MIRHIKPRAVWRVSTALSTLLMLMSAAARADDAALPDIVVKETPTVAERYQMPNTIESVTAAKLADTVNVIDPEDVVKYMPSVSVRKRNNGDTQSILATRTWGYNSSARSLVYADNIPISALIANDNTRGGPRWGLVAPEEISRADMIYGPFSAAESGNSMGGILRLTTRMPDKFEATLKQTESAQTFAAYNTKDVYRTDQTNATIGGRVKDLGFFFAGSTANSFSQPLSMVTNSGGSPTGTSGQIPAISKTGTAANVIGAGGLLHTEMENAKAKLTYDLTPEIQAAYILGFWQNHGRSRVESYLKDANGAATYGTTGTSGTGASFANNNYILEQAHTTHALSVKSDTNGMWDFEAVATHYHYDRDIQKQPLSSVGGLNFSTNGKFSQMDGTNWTTGDLKGIWRPEGKGGDHEASFGWHYDRYILVNTTYLTSNWRTEAPVTGKSTDSRGNTQTDAFWVQDVWKLTDTVKATVGGRYEYWETFKGYVMSSTGDAKAKDSERTAFSPKGSLTWEFQPQWTLTGSAARAIRFPTVSELYLSTGTGSNTTIAAPGLTPERATSYELSLETTLGEGKTRLSLFQENVAKALISQTMAASGNTTTSYVANVDEIQNRGVELAVQQDNVLIRGFDLSGSLTYVDSETRKDPTWAGGTQVEGKRVPYVPMWRSTLVGTYRPTDELAFTAAARYQGKMSSTLDNTDYVHHVMGAFDQFFVVDVRAHYKYNENLEAALGVDNLNNAKYWEYHPFPQRTFIGELKMKL